ncbi:MAG: hypothetical protein D6706_13055 [Chloroflexi bacterium]|nr:MAG: hypothetical protein D6706_13055 [Chloroflexota bacterium]
MKPQNLNEPSPFEYWVAYLAIADQWEEAWTETYDAAISNWELDICWRLLREARRLAIHPSQQALVRFREGMLHAQSGDWQHASVCYESALASAVAENDELQLPLLGEMGMLYRLQGDFRKALDLHRRQYKLAMASGDLWYQAEALDQIGLDYEAAGQLKNAQLNLELALQLWQALEAKSSIASTFNHLGMVTWQQGDLEAAEFYLTQAHEMAITTEHSYSQAQIEGNLGNLAYERAQWDVAEAHYAQALSRFDELGVVFDKIGIINNLAGIAVARHEYDQARMLYKESLALAQTLGHRQGELDALLNLSVVALRQRSWSEVPDLHAQALRIARALGDRHTFWDIRRRQMRFVVLYGLLRLLDWIRVRLGTARSRG